MRPVLVLIAFLFQSDIALSKSEVTVQICGLDENELYGPANISQYFDSLEARCSLVEGEALIMEYSFDKYCLSEEYEEMDLCVGDSTIRDGGVENRCEYFAIEKYDVDSSFKFSTKFKRRIYSTRLNGKANIWFKSKGKGAFKLIGESHECL